MSANNQTLVKQYKGKWYVFRNVQAESWVTLDDDDKAVDGRDNELSLKEAVAVFDTKEEAMVKAYEVDAKCGQFEEGTEYGVSTVLVKDGADVNIKEEEIKEIVICAAVIAKDGKIVKGHRHNDAIRTLHGMVGYEQEKVDTRHQGFITSKNRYVDRREGLRIQLAQGIPSADKDGYRYGELYSEDLY